jgi:ElaA protein
MMNKLSSSWTVSSYDLLSTENLYKILKARNLVFVCEQKICYQDLDDFDQKVFHVWKTDLTTQDIIAYGRILPPGIKYPERSFGRILTLSKYRGKGLGKELIHVCVDEMKKRFPGEKIKISAQYYLKQFYQEFGFITMGDPYIE